MARIKKGLMETLAVIIFIILIAILLIIFFNIKTPSI